MSNASRIQCRFRFVTVIAIVLSHVALSTADNKNVGSIKPYAKNPRYWQYKGMPVLLLGGTKRDNIFQIPDLEEHLDLLVSSGGNYVRNLMHSGWAKDENVYPFYKRDDGKYDLTRFNDAYWQRFEGCLQLASERDIIVQIEVWEPWEFGDASSWNNSPSNPDPSDRWLGWHEHPYNPKNNVNYTEQESGLKEEIGGGRSEQVNRFFFTVPALDDNQTVLRYQQAQVDKMLSISFQYGNVLYCMDNEFCGIAEWSAYWSHYIRNKAADAGVAVYTTEMWDMWDITHSRHHSSYDHRDLYSFADISQNNHNIGQKHWDNIQWVRDRISKFPRPLNNVKTYGADTGHFASTRDGIERFWRNIFGGCASSRFHRPRSGLGLTDRAQASIRSARLLASELDIFNCIPDSKSEFLSNRSDNEAYLTGILGEQYAVYFPDGGSVDLDLSESSGTFSMKWLDVETSRWQDDTTVRGGGKIRIETPGSGNWVALLEVSHNQQR